MKICLINNLYKPFNRGGAERVIEILAEGLSQNGHEVFIITTSPRFNGSNIINNKFKIFYLNSFYYNLNKIPKIFRFFWHLYDMFDFLIAFKVKNIIKNIQPDIVITNNLKGVCYMIPRVLKKLKIKHIHILHDIQLIHPSGLLIYGEEKKIKSIFAKIYIRLVKFLFNSPKIVISPSKWLLDFHVNLGFFNKSKCVILPNPVVLSSARINYNFKKNKFKILYAGQIEYHKGIIFLINAVKQIKDINIELNIAGDGSLLTKIKSKVASMNNINILGRLTEEELNKYLVYSDCVVVPSLCYENSPNIIYKAASIGKIIIASNIGGITELINYIGGVIFKAGDRDDLIKNIKWAYENADNLSIIGEKSINKISEFNINNYVKKLLSINFI